MVLKELIFFLQFPLWKNLMVLKGLIFNVSHHGKKCWSCKTDLDNFHFGYEK